MRNITADRRARRPAVGSAFQVRMLGLALEGAIAHPDGEERRQTLVSGIDRMRPIEPDERRHDRGRKYHEGEAGR